MLCLMAQPQIHPPNVKTCLDVVNSYEFVVSCAARLYAADSAALWMNVIHLSSTCMAIPVASAGVLLPMPRRGRKKLWCIV